MLVLNRLLPETRTGVVFCLVDGYSYYGMYSSIENSEGKLLVGALRVGPPTLGPW